MINKKLIGGNEEVKFYLTAQDIDLDNYVLIFKNKKIKDIIKKYHTGCFHCHNLTGVIMTLTEENKNKELMALGLYFSQIYENEHIAYKNYSNEDLEQDIWNDVSIESKIMTKCNMCNKIVKDESMNHIIFNNEGWLICDICFNTFNLNKIQFIFRYSIATIPLLEDRFKKHINTNGLSHLNKI